MRDDGFMTRGEFLKLSLEQQLALQEADLEDYFSTTGLRFDDIISRPHLFIVTFAEPSYDGDELYDLLKTAIEGLDEPLTESDAARLVEAIRKIAPTCLNVIGRSDLIRAVNRISLEGATGYDFMFEKKNVWWVMGHRL